MTLPIKTVIIPCAHSSVSIKGGHSKEKAVVDHNSQAVCIFLQDDKQLASCELNYVIITELRSHMSEAGFLTLSTATFGPNDSLWWAV